MSRIPNVENELRRVLCDVSGLPAEELTPDASFVDQGLDSLSLTQATLELERVFGVKLRFRRLLEDLDTIAKLARYLDAEMPAEKFAPAPAPLVAAAPAALPASAPAQVGGYAAPATQLQPMAPLAAGSSAVHQLLAQQMQLMAQQLAVLQKLCHDLMAHACGAPARFFPATELPAAPRWTALAAWSRELMQAARSVEHPYNAGLMQEAWAARTRQVLAARAP